MVMMLEGRVLLLEAANSGSPPSLCFCSSFPRASPFSTIFGSGERWLFNNQKPKRWKALIHLVSSVEALFCSRCAVLNSWCTGIFYCFLFVTLLNNLPLLFYYFLFS